MLIIQVMPHPPVLRAVKMVVDHLQEAGHTVVPWEPFKHKEAVDMANKIYAADAGTVWTTQCLPLNAF
jgi:amidase